jgi:hypothetical protein
VGDGAGMVSQGTQSIALGYLAGHNTTHANSIILNASGAALNSGGTSRTYISPIRAITSSGGGVLVRDSSTSEVQSLVKNIVYLRVTVGANSGGTPADFKQVAFSYGFTAAATNKLVITATPMNVGDYGDTFTVTVNNITTTGAELNVLRLDSDTSWGQQLIAGVCVVELN